MPVYLCLGCGWLWRFGDSLIWWARWLLWVCTLGLVAWDCLGGWWVASGCRHFLAIWLSVVCFFSFGVWVCGFWFVLVAGFEFRLLWGGCGDAGGCGFWVWWFGVSVAGWLVGVVAGLGFVLGLDFVGAVWGRYLGGLWV